MRTLIRTTDPVAIDYVMALLRQAGIVHAHWDRSISAIEGSIGAFPQRVVVREADWRAACHLLEDAGLAHLLAEAER